MLYFAEVLSPVSQVADFIMNPCRTSKAESNLGFGSASAISNMIWIGCAESHDSMGEKPIWNRSRLVLQKPEKSKK